MPSEMNQIDRYLKEKLKEASIDQSKLNTDWAAMSSLLIVPAPKPTPKSRRVWKSGNTLAFVGGIIMIVSVTSFLVLNSRKKISHQHISSIKPIPKNKAPKDDLLASSVIANNRVAPNQQQFPIHSTRVISARHNK